MVHNEENTKNLPYTLICLVWSFIWIYAQLSLKLDCEDIVISGVIWGIVLDTVKVPCTYALQWSSGTSHQEFTLISDHACSEFLQVLLQSWDTKRPFCASNSCLAEFTKLEPNRNQFRYVIIQILVSVHAVQFLQCWRSGLPFMCKRLWSAILKNVWFPTMPCPSYSCFNPPLIITEIHVIE